MSNKNLSIYIFKIIPTSFLSRLFGGITRIPLPSPLINSITKWWCKNFNVKSDEFTAPDNGFKNLDQFFTRELNPGVHKIDSLKNVIVAPTDSRIDQYGKIDEDILIQAKGVEFYLTDLIPSRSAGKFKNGSFMTFYLSPGDYHRIHSPVSGTITGYFNIPGKLLTVQEYMVRGLQGLFSKNERLISYIENKKGLTAVVKVGAMNVGRISLSYSPVITNKAFRKQEELFYDKDNLIEINKGDELGIFHLGSTIVLLFQEDMVEFDDIKIGHIIRIGERIGVYKR